MDPNSTPEMLAQHSDTEYIVTDNNLDPDLEFELAIAIPPFQDINNNEISETSSNLTDDGPRPAFPELSFDASNNLLNASPTVFLHYVQFLQERVRELESERQRLLVENDQLRLNLRVATSATTIEHMSRSSSATRGAESSGSLQAEAHNTLTVTTTSTPVLSLYTRTGQDEVHPLPTRSSHSIITIRPPTFLSTQNSVVSVDGESREASDPGSPADSINCNPKSDKNTSKTAKLYATRSSPNLETRFSSEFILETGSLCLDVDNDGRSDDGLSTGPKFIAHLRHSWPSIKSDLVIADYTAQLSDYLSEMFSDSSASGVRLRNTESNTSWTTIDSSVASDTSIRTPEYPRIRDRSIGSSEDTDAELEELPNEGIERLFDEMESIVASQARPATPPPLSAATTDDAIVEHPFLGGLRNFHDDFREALLIREAAQYNMRVAVEQIIPTGRQVAPRQNITMAYTLRGSDVEQTFMSRLRSNLYYNVNLFAQDMDMISPADEAGSEHYLDFITDSSESSNALSIPHYGEDAGQYAEFMDNIDFHNEGDAAVEDMLPDDEDGESDSDSTESSEDSLAVNGDADGTNVASVSSSSSSGVSMNVTITTTRQETTPQWGLPSYTTIGGGKYDYLRVTDRPRPYHGHRFVVSVFGSTMRRENEARLPSWVPTYAERLECILNQYITQKNHVFKPRNSRGESSKSMDDEFSALELADSENTFYCRVRRNTSSIKRLKSCLKISHEGRIGESVAKVISWSEKVCVVENFSPRTSSQEDLINSNVDAETDADSVVSKTRSCPHVFCSTDKAKLVIPGPRISYKRIPIQAMDLEGVLRSKKKKKRTFRAVLKRICVCHHCTCAATLSNSSSLDSNEPDRNNNKN